MSNFDPNLSQAMRDGMRRLASGVCVISALDEKGKRYAMTASSVTSLSDTPASLLICVHEDARIHSAIGEKNAFSISILGAHQKDISQLCASPEEGENRFSVGDWRLDADTGLYYLGDAQSVFMCELDDTHVYGTHSIFIGKITKVELPGSEIDPLIYVDGGYRV